MSRPIVHDPVKVWDALIPLISTGSSLPAALRKLPPPRPGLWWCKQSLRNNPELEARYRDAQELRADSLADEIAAIIAIPMPTGLRGSEANAWVQHQRLRADNLKWIASKLFPRRYSERIDITANITNISITAALSAANHRLLEDLPHREPITLLPDIQTLVLEHLSKTNQDTDPVISDTPPLLSN